MLSSLLSVTARLPGDLVRKSPARLRRPGLAGGMTLLIGALSLTLASCSQSGAPDSGRGPLPAGTYPEKPLAVGAKAPDLTAADWLNGPPPPTGSAGARLTVLDVWAGW
jgi:hypothetical protein